MEDLLTEQIGPVDRAPHDLVLRAILERAGEAP